MESDLPPLKWSSLKYYFDRGGYGDGQEEAYGRRDRCEASAGRCAHGAGSAGGGRDPSDIPDNTTRKLSKYSLETTSVFKIGGSFKSLGTAMKKSSDDQYSKLESKERFEAALRGARIGAKPMKDMPKRFEDPMPENDPVALVQWAKRNIQKD